MRNSCVPGEYKKAQGTQQKLVTLKQHCITDTKTLLGEGSPAQRSFMDHDSGS